MMFADHRLPRGRHRLGPEFVAEHQRWRLIGAAVDALEERGYAAVTARDIGARAAVSSSAFYRHFENVPALLAASFEVAARAFLETLSEACRTAGGAPARPEAALRAACGFVGDDPALANLLGVEAAAAVAEIAARRAGLLGRLSALAARSAGGVQPGHDAAVAATFALILAGQASAARIPELLEVLAAVGIDFS